MRFFFSSRRRHTRFKCDWSSDVCSSDLVACMRRGELLGLRWRDVDLDGVRLSVRQQYTRQGKSLGFGPPKSAKSIRTIDLDGETADLVREQRQPHPSEPRPCANAYRPDLDLLFCRPAPP